MNVLIVAGTCVGIIATIWSAVSIFVTKVIDISLGQWNGYIDFDDIESDLISS